MGKLKTKKGVAKRFKLTKTGKLKYHSGGKSHLLSSKKAKRLRRLRRSGTVTGSKQRAFVKSMLPYG
jgi:large subunit ribosomal protein L35